MFIFTSIICFITLVIVKKYSLSITNVVKNVFHDNMVNYDDMISGKHHVAGSTSDIEMDSETESEYESESESESIPVSEPEVPCYMRDFYEESNLSKNWMSKTDEEKRQILDKEIEDYTNKYVINHLRDIAC
jgi:hypothetical protein